MPNLDTLSILLNELEAAVAAFDALTPATRARVEDFVDAEFASAFCAAIRAEDGSFLAGFYAMMTGADAARRLAGASDADFEGLHHLVNLLAIADWSVDLLDAETGAALDARFEAAAAPAGGTSRRMPSLIAAVRAVHAGEIDLLMDI